MVDINDLSPGMVVKIVDNWNDNTGQNTSGLMDKYLGTFMTIKEVKSFDILMEEDQGDRILSIGKTFGWYWNKYAIDYIVSEAGEAVTLPDLSEMI